MKQGNQHALVHNIFMYTVTTVNRHVLKQEEYPRSWWNYFTWLHLMWTTSNFHGKAFMSVKALIQWIRNVFWSIQERWMEGTLCCYAFIRNAMKLTDGSFKCISLNENVWVPNTISLKFVSKCKIDNNKASIQMMAWRLTGDNPLGKISRRVAAIISLRFGLFLFAICCSFLSCYGAGRNVLPFCYRNMKATFKICFFVYLWHRLQKRGHSEDVGWWKLIITLFNLWYSLFIM